MGYPEIYPLLYGHTWPLGAVKGLKYRDLLDSVRELRRDSRKASAPNIGGLTARIGGGVYAGIGAYEIGGGVYAGIGA